MEKRFVYADNAATTPLSEIAFNAMKPWLTEHYGNPSSLYRMGREAKEAINEARKVVGKCLNAAMPVNEKNDYAPGEILFTGGGSQADNLAIRGFMHGPSSKGRKHIITSKIEHHAVLYTCEALEKEGFRVTYLNVDKEGHVDLEQLKRELSEDTALVSIMAANNEIGTIQPLKQISETGAFGPVQSSTPTRCRQSAICTSTYRKWASTCCRSQVINSAARAAPACCM